MAYTSLGLTQRVRICSDIYLPIPACVETLEQAITSVLQCNRRGCRITEFHCYREGTEGDWLVECLSKGCVGLGTHPVVYATGGDADRWEGEGGSCPTIDPETNLDTSTDGGGHSTGSEED